MVWLQNALVAPLGSPTGFIHHLRAETGLMSLTLRGGLVSMAPIGADQTGELSAVAS